MLQTFLRSNREELILRCRAKAAKRRPPLSPEEKLDCGVAKLLTQIGDILFQEHNNLNAGLSAVPWESNGAATEIGTAAKSHGNDLLRLGFTVEQVVHCYGDLCQAVTEMAMERKAQIPNEEFHILNRCLDNAIAGAVCAFTREREPLSPGSGVSFSERQSYFENELRLIRVAALCVAAIKNGHVGIFGSTGAILDSALKELEDRNASVLAAAGSGSGTPEQASPILAWSPEV